MTNREQISVPLPAELREFVKRAAEREDLSVAGQIRYLVAEAARREADVGILVLIKIHHSSQYAGAGDRVAEGLVHWRNFSNAAAPVDQLSAAFEHKLLSLRLAGWLAGATAPAIALRHGSEASSAGARALRR
jgi:hypothetical protein